VKTIHRILGTLVLVSCVVVLGVAWEHSSAATLLVGRMPSRSQPLRAGPPDRELPVPPVIRHSVHGSAAPHWSNAPNLAGILLLETGLGGIVVAADVLRRHRHRLSRQP
jgi:hypothetical protein